jgi:PEP-CTERM motif
MKSSARICWVLLIVALVCADQNLRAQGNFQNLDFESAIIVPIPGDVYGRVEFAPAFPGWTGYIGTNQVPLALHNNIFLGSAGLGIMEESGGGFHTPVIEGNYMAVLQAGVGGPTGTNRLSAAIAQTSLIPVNSQSLLFKTGSSITGPFEVTVGGQTISMIPLLNTATYTVLAGDICAFAGQTHELKIAGLPGNFVFTVDSIVFSSQPVPEPSALGLFALGGLLLIWKRRRG